jgi:hypothetical protein
MKFIKNIVAALFVAVAATGCIKQEGATFTAPLVELDVAAYNAVFGANTFPYVFRQNAAYGRAVIGADAIFTRTSGNATFRVNILGAQSATVRTIRYQTFVVGNALGTTLPANPGTTTYSSTVINTNFEAVVGTHYTLGGGVATIPANSSFGFITIPILNTGTSATTTALVGLELIAGGDLAPSANYNKIVFGINQR